NDGRVSRVVLGNSGLDLANEVGADVGAFREDAAAQARENRDQRAAERETDERLQDLVFGHAERVQHEVVTGDAEKAQADDEKTRDGAALEGQLQGGIQALRGRLRRAHVGAYRDEHADVAGEAREDRAYEEADGRVPIQRDTEDHEQHDARDRDRRVLPVHVGARAYLNRGRDLLHARVAG